ncbi:MAG: ABC transporter permease [Thermoproteales archaeon]|nr:ABC transporter permease [Thermoproteales archaeon]
MKMFHLFAAGGALIILFLFIPLILVFVFTSPEYIIRYGLDNEAINALFITILSATTSTIILIFLGVPLAYIFSRKDFIGKKFFKALIDIPLVIPHSVVGIMILLAYNSRSTIGSIFNTLGFRIEDSFWGIVLGMMFVSAPLIIDTVENSFNSVSRSLENVARSLGASPFKTFINVTFPLTINGVVTGALLSWARAISEVGALLIIAYYPKTVNILIIERFYNIGLNAALGTMIPLLVISILVFLMIRSLARRS